MYLTSIPAFITLPMPTHSFVNSTPTSCCGAMADDVSVSSGRQ